MRKRGSFLGHFRRYSLWLSWAAGFSVLLCFVVLVFLTSRVILGLEQQRTASSDNVQWTLTQVEVEHLAFLNALEQHLHAEGGPVPVPQDLTKVRRQFDVFYSRVDTLSRAQLYEPLRQTSDFGRPLAKVTGFLDQAVPLIDGPDQGLQNGIVELWQEAHALRSQVRLLSLHGLAYFAGQSDLQRAETTATLTRLAILSIGLLVVLALASIYLIYINRITQRRGDDLVKANQRMNTILSTSHDAVIVSDESGKVIEFNRAAESIFGYGADEAKGRSIGDLIVPPELRDLHAAGIKRMRHGGERRVVGHGRVQLQGMRKNGDVFPVELALQSAPLANGEIIIGFLRDISETVAAQEELIAARDKALAGERAKSDFLKVMSHEIRTPLNGLLGNLSLLKNLNPSRQQVQIIQNMDLSGQLLLTHVDTVLDIARFEAGKLSVQREPIDLGVLMQELVDSQSGNAAQRGNSIEWQWSGPARPWVATDAQRLRQILLNLVGNAIKFCENGRISLEVEVAEESAPGQHPVYEFRIVDTGVGIAEEHQDEIFEDFHTHDPSFERSAGGTGLGLGIARRFTQAMGGEIGVESSVGEGSVFWVRLPLEVVDAARRPSAHEAQLSDLQCLDLLVVEDNDINLAVIRKMLEIDGHKVTTAKNGKEGVDAAYGHRFDAILMDVSMPVMDGPTAARHIRAGEGRSVDVPILAVSANVLPEAVQGFRDAGMTAFVGKPLALSTLRKALAALLGGKHPVGEGSAREMHEPLNAMREDLGPDAFDRFAERFVAEADAMLGDLGRSDWAEGDLDTLASQSHRLAGSAAMYGFLELRDVLVNIEMAAKDNDREVLASLAGAASTAWEDARATVLRARQA